jgi:hypothetical protein
VRCPAAEVGLGEEMCNAVLDLGERDPYLEQSLKPRASAPGKGGTQEA